MKERKNIKFHSGFETPVRPGLLRLNSEFSFPHPITASRDFRVCGCRITRCSYRAYELDEHEPVRAAFGSRTGLAMGVTCA
ncbi:MAG TPA: hypothetical protein VJA21_02750 [Verrucomicrobiae bacterium]